MLLCKIENFHLLVIYYKGSWCYKNRDYSACGHIVEQLVRRHAKRSAT